MIRNLIVLAMLFLFAFSFYKCATSISDDVVVSKKNSEGYYYFQGGNGDRIWINPSMREGSLSGHYRGRGPNAGK